MNINVIFAVFKRNFISYFANPTGYVFICLFVMLSGGLAFWPAEFFNNNLANLDQLNAYFPLVMLFFIPAITMSIWADERRQGTDELLLTVPAGDFAIVLGKYLAATAIFTASLVFSLVCNSLVLMWLAAPGVPDLGLFLCTYVGYWLIGLAMLAVGMVASFLTGNLTMAFVLGAVFNIPLVLIGYFDLALPDFLVSFVNRIAGAETISSNSLASIFKQMSIGGQFVDFGRGVFSFTSAVYFLAITAVMLYLCMVLIGRRHWAASGANRANMVFHYAVRTAALLAIAAGAVVVFGRHDARLDLTNEHLSSLSKHTRELIAKLDKDKPVRIDAFISPVVPDNYVQPRLNLLSALREIQARGAGKVTVNVLDTERFTDKAQLALDRYAIEPRRVLTRAGGKYAEDFIFMHVVVDCGAKRVGPIFMDRGLPPEYELVRSIATVSGAERKKVGVLLTDAQMFGSFNFQSGGASPDWPIIEELKKQYTVVKVDPMQPITEKMDVLLAVQPSSLDPQGFQNFLTYVESGAPVAIFEDPFPYLVSVPGTKAPRQPMGGMNPMMMGRNAPPPKGPIARLWNTLGVDFSTDSIVWQKYNPYPKLTFFSNDPEWVFIDSNRGTLSGEDAVTSGLQELLFPFPGSITKLNSSSLEFTPLAKTGETEDGTVPYDQMMSMSMMGMRGGEINPNRRHKAANQSFVLSAKIKGELKPNQPMAGEEAGEGAPTAEPSVPAGDPMPPVMDEADGLDKSPISKQPPLPPQPRRVNVILTADLDMLTPAFFKIRESGDNPESGVDFKFQNVAYVLNVIDELAGDDRFVEIRKRRPVHHTLQRIEDRTKQAREESSTEREQFIKDFEKAEQEEREKLEKKLKELQNQRDRKDPMQLIQEVAVAQRDGERRIETAIEQAKKIRDGNINKIETNLAMTVKRVQSQYKIWAVLLPPIPPLVLALAVFLIRRGKEREGVAKTRLR